MFRAFSLLCAVGGWTLVCGTLNVVPQGVDKKERTGTVVGELKSRIEAKNGRSVTLEILAPGEEKPRRYLVAYNPRDPAAEKPYRKLLAKVNLAIIGDRVRIAWVNAPKGAEGGFFVTDFEILNKVDRKVDGKGKSDRDDE